MTEAVQQAEWWNQRRSLGDIAEHLERVFKDKQSLERKLTELVEENSRLATRCAKADAELTAITESMGKLKDKTQGQGRHEAELAVRERLLRDEFERKTQDLQLEMNKERRQLEDRVEKLKDDLAGCFCRQSSGEHVVQVMKRPAAKTSRIPNRRMR